MSLAIEKDSRQVVRPKVTIDMTSNAPAPEEESKEASDKRKNKAEEPAAHISGETCAGSSRYVP